MNETTGGEAPPAPRPTNGSGPTAPPDSVLTRTARGAGWVIAWRLATRALGFASTLVLVRLLSPEDFGLVALAAAFAVALEVCLEIGVEEQIIRTPQPTPALYHTAFTLSLIRALLVGAMVLALAAPAAAFFGDPRLGPVLVALGLLAMADGLINVGVVDFRRDLAFDREFRFLLWPRVAGIVVTIAIAFMAPGEWALVAGIAVNRLGRVVLSYVMHPFRPRLMLAEWRALAGVSVLSWAIGVVGMARDRSDSFVIGRMMGTAEVGIFAAGAEIATLPTTELVEPVARACFPGFAASAREGADMAEAWRRIIGLSALVSLPLGTGLSLVAADLVHLAYGPAWMAAAPVVVVIGLSAAVSPLASVSQAMLGARTMLRTILCVFLLTMAVRVGLLLALTPALGLLGAALAVAASGLLDNAVQVGIAQRRLGLPPGTLPREIARPVLAAAAMAGLLWSLGLGWTGGADGAGEALWRVLMAVPLGAAFHVAVSAALWWLAGRPARSAEADLIAAVRRALGRA